MGKILVVLGKIMGKMDYSQEGEEKISLFQDGYKDNLGFFKFLE